MSEDPDYAWKNPMRFSIGHKEIDVRRFGIDVTGIDVRPSEGNIYVHWEEEDE